MRSEACKECPFKKNSAPGYLGEASYDPEKFLASIEFDPIPCHMMVNWDEAGEDQIDMDRWKNTCKGSLQFLKNSCKMPRDPEYNRLRNSVDSNSEIFSRRQDFINHHSPK